MSKFVIFICSFIFTLICYEGVRACDCHQKTNSAVEDFDASAAVFTGTVISINKTSIKESRDYFAEYRILIRPRRIFRTPYTSNKSFMIYTGATGGGDCGYSFRRGQIYLIYAYKIKGWRLYTSSCTKTKLFSEASQDIQEIRQEIEKRNNKQPKRKQGNGVKNQTK